MSHVTPYSPTRQGGREGRGGGVVWVGGKGIERERGGRKRDRKKRKGEYIKYDSWGVRESRSSWWAERLKTEAQGPHFLPSLQEGATYSYLMFFVICVRVGKTRRTHTRACVLTIIGQLNQVTHTCHVVISYSSCELSKQHRFKRNPPQQGEVFPIVWVSSVFLLPVLTEFEPNGLQPSDLSRAAFSIFYGGRRSWGSVHLYLLWHSCYLLFFLTRPHRGLFWSSSIT